VNDPHNGPTAPWEDDPSYIGWLEDCAKDCGCCPCCAPESPCAGVMAGGMCDGFAHREEDIDEDRIEADV
jgi:hypothetical protein